MNIVIAIDSFKGSISSIQAGNAVASGIRRVFEDSDISVCLIADGGAGKVEARISDNGGPTCIGGNQRFSSQYINAALQIAALLSRQICYR